MKTFKKLSEAMKMKGKDPCWKGYQMVGMKDKGGKKVPNCVPEEVQVEELTPSSKPEPGREAVGNRFVSGAPKKPIKTTPQVTSEAKEEKPPFDPDPPKKKSVVAGKYGAGYSTARHLARMAMQKQSEKYKKPIKEDEDLSKKAQIVKDVVKGKKKKDTSSKDDAFQAEPILSKSQTKNY